MSFDSPIAYMQRTREYYLALGYGNPYVWAQHDDARFLFSDFPLGNSAGRPHDQDSQELTLELALALLETAAEPRTTLQSPLRWSGSAEWKLDYCNAARMSPEELARRRADFDRGKEAAKALRESIA